MGPDAMILVFWMLSFKPTFSLSSFIFIKSLFSSSWLSAIRVVSSAHLRLLMFLLPILIPAYNSSTLAFLIMYSTYRLNKQGDSRQPCCYSFLSLEPIRSSIQGSNCSFLTRIQVSQETGKMVSYLVPWLGIKPGAPCTGGLIAGPPRKSQQSPLLNANT